MEQPRIQIGYIAKRGGVGTVSAMVIEQPMDIAQAKSSTTNLMRLVR
jgi:predicted NUDIX family NTP pyrophosphohydrolase